MRSLCALVSLCFLVPGTLAQSDVPEALQRAGDRNPTGAEEEEASKRYQAMHVQKRKAELAGGARE